MSSLASFSRPSRALTPRALNLFLWVSQAILAFAFILAGLMKLTMSMTDLAQQMTWATLLPGWLVRIVGVVEFTAGLGLVVPAASKIKPEITSVAALSLIPIMFVGCGLHWVESEFVAFAVNLFFLALAAFVGWGRSMKFPIRSR